MPDSAPPLLIGREHELDALMRAVADARDGRGGIVWVSGEAGIGKTRLVEECARRAAAPDTAVVWARCVDAAAAPPYWLWAECLRELARADRLRLSTLPRVTRDRLNALVPELATRQSKPSRTASLRSGSDRYHLFDAVRAALQHAASRGAVAIILEDVHQADPSSLLLLEFLARGLARSPLLFVMTCRDDELAGPVVETLGELVRLGLRQLALTGLSLNETRDLLGRLCDQPCSDALVRQVQARTSGNPFFVTQIAHLDPAERDRVPPHVRAAVGQRLGRLSDLTRQLLHIGSVTGREFDFRLVAQMLPAASEPELLAALDEALERLIIEPVPGGAENSYQFRHALVRETVYESASPSRRAHWHAALVTVLEQRLGAAAGNQAADLAYHSIRAESLVGSSRVARYSRLAGEQLLEAHAFDEALPHFQRAWRARTSVPRDDDVAAILAGLGQAQAATAVRWNRQEAWAHVRRAVEHYVDAGDIDRAAALVTHPSLAAEGVLGVAEVIGTLLPKVEEESPVAAALLARAAAAVYFETGTDRPARQWFARALAIASSRVDAALELRVLAQSISVDHFALRWHEALARSHRVLDLARRVDQLHEETYATYRAAFVMLHTGRTAEASAHIQANLTLAERLRDRGLLADALYLLALQAQLGGDWDRARAHSDRGLALSPAHLPLLHVRVVVEHETGHDEAGLQYLERLRDADRDAHPYPLAGVFTAIALAQIAYLSNGVQRSEVVTAVRVVLSRAPAIANAVVSARMAHALLAVLDGDVDGCETDLQALHGLESVMPMQWGLSTSRVLGLLAHGAGQPRNAASYFDAALAFCRTSGFTPELAWTAHDYAAALLDLGRPADRVKAARLLDEGEQIAAALGMAPLSGRMGAFRERYRLRLARNPAGLTSRELEVLQLLAAGRANKEIAQALFISTHTVAVHVAKILEKTGASNRTEAAAYATRHHLLEPTRPVSGDP